MPWDPPPHLIPKQGEEHLNTQNMLYILWMVILGDQSIIGISFENFDF